MSPPVHRVGNLPDKALQALPQERHQALQEQNNATTPQLRQAELTMAFHSAESQTVFIRRTQRRILTTLPSGKPRATQDKICSPVPSTRRASVPDVSVRLSRSWL